MVADFTETQSLTEETERYVFILRFKLEVIIMLLCRFGGLVQDLVWDPRGERLAVIFRTTNYVALFRTRYSPTLSLFPW